MPGMDFHDARTAMVGLCVLLTMSQSGCNQASKEEAIGSTASALAMAPALNGVTPGNSMTSNIDFTGAGAHPVTGRAPYGYEIKRSKNGGAENLVLELDCTAGECPAAGTSTVVRDYGLMPFDATYAYQVRALYPSEPSEWSAVSSVTTVESINHIAKVPRKLKLMPIVAQGAATPFDCTWLTWDNVDAPGAMNTWLRELSAGVGAAPSDPVASVAVNCEDWRELAADHATILASGTGSWLDVYSSWLNASQPGYADWFWDPSEHWALIVETGDPAHQSGGFSTAPTWPPIVPIMIGSGEFKVAGGQAVEEREFLTLLHEYLHDHRLIHSFSGWCGSSTRPLPTGHSAAGFGRYCEDPGGASYLRQDGQNVMTPAALPGHLNVLQKIKAGWLPGRVRWVDTTTEGEPGPEGFDDLSGSGSTVTLSLYDHITKQPSTAVQAIIIKLGTDDTSYVLEFKQDAGTNTLMSTNGGTMIPFQRGVQIIAKPGYRYPSNAIAEPYFAVREQLGGIGPMILTPGEEMWDHGHCVKVEMLADHGAYADIRVTRVCPDYGDLVTDFAPDLAAWMEGAGADPDSWHPFGAPFSFNSGTAKPIEGTVSGVRAVGYAQPVSAAQGYRSSGGEDWFRSLHDGTGGTFAIAMQANAGGKNGHLFDETKGLATNTGLNVKYTAQDKIRIRVSNSSNTPLINAAVSLGASVTEPHFVIFRYDQDQSPQWSVYVDQGDVPDAYGSANGAPDVGSATLSPALLARAAQSSTQAFDGFVAEMIFIDRFATDLEVADLATYLKAKYLDMNACQATTCSALQVSCGAADDGCGGSLDCGTCNTGYTCSAGQCEQDPPADSCAGLCGGASASGNCYCDAACVGYGDCCGDYQAECGGSCTPTTCAIQGADCGSLADGCGGTLSCGTCDAPETCGGGGAANTCGQSEESCLGWCGGASQFGTCYCDALCVQYGDCCSDYANTCQ